MYEVFLTKEAVKHYKKCDLATRKRLDKCFEDLKKDPVDSPNVKRLHGELAGLFRYRAGDLRVIYKMEGNRIIVIITIGSRGDIYKRM
jgi:mRNA interferase RelE/StbE